MTVWGDSDSDYLDDFSEKYYQTDLLNLDTDSDGVLDGIEVYIKGSDPTRKGFTLILANPSSYFFLCLIILGIYYYDYKRKNKKISK